MSIDGPSISIAVRPSRLEMATARLALLLRGSEGRLPIGILSFVIGVGVSVGGLQFRLAVKDFAKILSIPSHLSSSSFDRNPKSTT
jgi:hypothetical protein